MASEARWRAIAAAHLVQIASTVLINQANVRYLLLASIICVKLISALFIIYTSVPLKYRRSGLRPSELFMTYSNGAASGDDDLVGLGVGSVLLLLFAFVSSFVSHSMTIIIRPFSALVASVLFTLHWLLFLNVIVFLSISVSSLLFWS